VRLFWKIAVSVACLALAGGGAALWWARSAKTHEQEVAEEAQACRIRAEQSDAKAEADLGYRYSHGEGVPQDYGEALKWRQKAADQGYPDGEDGLAFMYMEGQGVQQDYGAALGWYRKAAAQGDAKGENALGLMHSQGQGVPQDYGEALKWLQKAVDQGYATAEYNLGNMYYYGRGVQQDRAEAQRWYRKAADRGDEYALRVLGESLTASRKLSLWITAFFGLWLSLSFLSLNSFEPNKSLGDFRQRIKTGTGVLCLCSAWLGWYGYTHHMIRCWSCGPNAFTWLYWLLSGLVLASLFFIVLSARKPGDEHDEMGAGETGARSEGQTGPQ